MVAAGAVTLLAAGVQVNIGGDIFAGRVLLHLQAGVVTSCAPPLERVRLLNIVGQGDFVRVQR